MNLASAVCSGLSDRTATILQAAPGMVVIVVLNRRSPL
jgi:hypothetical protein